jgi:hypothetical protein
VLLLITRRRQLEGLSDSDNQRLRSIAMNRLLRTVATVAAGLGAIAGNFGMNTPPGTTAPFGGINYAGIVNIAVLVVMWRWRPPRLADVEMVENRETAAGSGHLIGLNHPAGKLVMSLGPLLGLAAAFPLIPGFLFSAVSPAVQMPALYGPAGYVGCAAVLVLLVIAAGEFLLRTNHCSADVPQGLPKVAVSPALTLTAVAAFIIFLVLLAITAAGAVKSDVASGWMEAGLPAVVVVALATLALLLTSKRPGIRAAPPGLDAALRSITSFRIVRTIAAFFAAEAALLVLYEDQAISMALGFGPAARPEYWGLVSGAGGLLAVCAVVIAVIPVRSFVRTPGNVVPQAEMDSVT